MNSLDVLFEELKATKGWRVFCRFSYIKMAIVITVNVGYIWGVKQSNPNNQDAIFLYAIAGVLVLISLVALYATVSNKPVDIKKCTVSSVKLNTIHKTKPGNKHVTLHEYIVMVESEGELIEGRFPCGSSSSGARNPQNIKAGDAVFWFQCSFGSCFVVK